MGRGFRGRGVVMGRRGPPPTPSDILRLRGSKLASRRGDEPRPRVARLKCPDWLDAEAKLKWKQVVKELSPVGVLTVVDDDVLAGYCQAYAEFQISTQTLQREGRILRTANGYPVPHPAVA